MAVNSRRQSLQFLLPFFDAWVQFPLCSQVLPMLSEVVVHIALGSFGLVERDRQVGKLLIEIIHQGYIGLALADGPEVRLDEFAIAGVGLVLLCLCEVFVPCLNAAAELLDGFSEYPCPGVPHGLDDGNGFCRVVMGFDGSRQRKW